MLASIQAAASLSLLGFFRWAQLVSRSWSAAWRFYLVD
jgi:hypothetical protein